MDSLKDIYQKQILPALSAELNLKNPLAVPRLVKVVVNVGVKEAAQNKSVLDHVVTDLAAITGQKPRINHAKKSIASFKLRQGDPIGAACTLRGKRMTDFLEKLFRIILPRVRDFRGVAGSGFDGRGNYTLGFPEQIVFPEVDYTKIDKIRGLEVTIVTTAKNNQAARRLLELLGLPFQKK
jgi:large subunit ribosomal protein L5